MWMQLAIWVGLMVLSALLTPKPKTSTPQPGEFKATVVDSSSPVPVLFGTRLLESANCVWYGDVATTPIKSSSGGKK